MASSWRADILVSIHADISVSPNPRGHHVIHTVRDGSGEGMQIRAQALVDEVQAATGREPFIMRGFVPTGRGTWARPSSTGPNVDYYGIIRHPLAMGVPALIIERGFMSNPRDLTALFDPEDFRRQAEGIANALSSSSQLPWTAGPCEMCADLKDRLREIRSLATLEGG